MATDVVMPQMGESIAEGTITKWLVKVGERVERDQPLFEISTDKVDAEIPSPASGVLIEVKFNAGATVAVNQLVALIGEPSEAKGAAPAAPAKPAPAEPAAAPASKVMTAAAPAGPAAAPASPEEERLRTFSSPLVRSIAEQEGVNIREVAGTGLQGRVTKEDILGYLEQRRKPAAPAAVPAAVAVPTAQSASTPPPAQPAPTPPPAPAAQAPEPAPQAAAPAPAAAAPPTTPAPAVSSAAPVAPPAASGAMVPATRPTTGFHVPAFVEGERVLIEPMSKMRQITSAHMIYSKATSAHVTTVFHMDLSRVARARDRAKDGFFRANGTKLTFMPFIFKAVASALKANPKLNASVDGANIVYKKDINLGMAVALDWGLIVPVIKNADTLNLIGLARAANDLADRARAKRLKPEEVQGGTFTITNPGVFGSQWGTPIINQPQVAILGIGVVEKRPVVVADDDGNDTIAIKMMAYFGISYDHRLVDGADADHFMNHVKKTLLDETWTELEPYG